jgi:hypothetical protein
MNTTLIAYKPNSTDHCKGCLMESYDSDFEIHHPETLEEAADIQARLETMELGYNEEGYEITLLFHDEGLENSDKYDLHEDLRGLTESRVKKIETERVEAAKKAQKRAAQKKAERKVASEKAQLAQLQAKYAEGGVA